MSLHTLHVRAIFVLGLAVLPVAYCRTVPDNADPFAPLTSPVLQFLDDFVKELTLRSFQPECQRDASTLVRDERLGKEWALRFLDSMGKPGSGVVEGGVNFPGYFSECTSTHSGGNFSGKYCLAQINFKSPAEDVEHNNSLPTFSKFSVGICAPSSCEKDAIEAAVLAAAQSLGREVMTELQACYTDNNEFTLDIATGFVIFIFSTFILLAIVGTFLDLTRCSICQRKTNSLTESPSLQRTDKLSDDVVVISRGQASDSSEVLCKNRAHDSVLAGFFLSFSVISNSRKILNTAAAEGTFGALHGIRFLSMAWIMIGHTMFFAQKWLFFRNPNTMTSATKKILSQAFANGTFAVDTFFFLSGFLVAHTLLRELHRTSGAVNVVQFYVHRYLRMTPVMMIVIAFSSTFLKYLGSGPSWKEATMMYDEWCRENWWVNALYVQNFLNRNHMCLSHTWYSSVDMQFYLVSSIIVGVCYWNFYGGILLLLAFFSVTTVCPMIFTIMYHLPAVPNDTVPESVMDNYFGLIYIKPYCRMGPYLVGIVMAYFIYKKNTSFRISKRYQVLGWMCAIIANVCVIYSMGRVFNADPPTDIEAAIYNGFARTAWAATVAWLAFNCAYGQADILNWILSARLTVPLSRLTYSAYLVHPVLMAMFYGTRETVFDFSLYWLIYMVIGNLMITYIVSFILSILFESPIMNIEKLFQRS